MSKIVIDQVHTENVLQRMWEQCQSEESCDVVLIAATDDTRIPAHRSVLTASSDYFKAMFTPPYVESVLKEVKLSSGDGNILKQIIKFCYTGRLEIKDDIAENLLKIADLFSLEFVVNACANYLEERLDPTNCLGFWLLAERYRCQSLLEQSREYCLGHFMEANKTDEFLRLTAEQLGQLLASDDLRVLAEEDVYNSIITWIRYDPSKREAHKDEMLKFVRMELLQPSFAIDHLKSLSISFEANQFIKCLEWQIMPESRISTKFRRSYQVLMAITQSEKIYIHYYCPQRLKWMKWMKDLEIRHDFAVAVTDHKLYIVGGRCAGRNTLNSVICLNLDTMTLSPTNPMTQHRRGCRATVLNGFLYVVGGHHAGPALSSVEKLDPKTNTWSMVAAMSVPRYDFGIAQLNEKVYVVGGTTDSCECYDPHTNVWNPIESMADSRVLNQVVCGQMYAVGGHNSKQTAERFIAKANKCSLRENFQGLPNCTTFQDKVIFCYSDRIEQYNPSTNEWEDNKSLKGLANSYYIFPYSGKLLKAEFTEN